MLFLDMLKYSIIIPSRGDRPKALALAIDSVLTARDYASLSTDEVEILVGFDGVKGERVRSAKNIKYFDLPSNNDFGNAIRHALLKAANGKRLVFLDDDNVLTKQAFRVYEAHQDTDMLIARIDVSNAHDIPFLPRPQDDLPLIRPANIDPLCLCLTRELVLTLCQGWLGDQYEADYKNIFRYSRRAKNIQIIDDIVGIYDAGRGLDDALNFRQKALLAKNKI